MKPAAARGARETQQARRDGPERSCVVTRTVKSPDDLIRFVVGPDNMLVPDLRRKLPGRGVWASLSAAAVAEAVKRRAFERSLKTKVVVPPDLGETIDALMLKDALQALAMANKAGLAQAGFAKVEAVIGSGRCAAVIEASDGAEDGRRKIAQALRRAEIAREEAAEATEGARRGNFRGSGFGIGVGARTCDTCGACSGTSGRGFPLPLASARSLSDERRRCNRPGGAERLRPRR
ncbi:MAG: DNA-binding protein [Methylobacterium sp.]|nr:DNA-binding protein [Methylobacterium sp.]